MPFCFQIEMNPYLVYLSEVTEHIKTHYPQHLSEFSDFVNDEKQKYDVKTSDVKTSEKKFMKKIKLNLPKQVVVPQQVVEVPQQVTEVPQQVTEVPKQVVDVPPQVTKVPKQEVPPQVAEVPPQVAEVPKQEVPKMSLKLKPKPVPPLTKSLKLEPPNNPAIMIVKEALKDLVF